MLTPGRHDLQHDFSHAPLVITGLLTDLIETGGINIQGLHIDQDFVVINLHCIIQALGPLGEAIPLVPAPCAYHKGNLKPLA